jgi:hypothetical protein
MNKETFEKIWDETLGKVEGLEFECSPQLEAHLMKIANDEYTDDEIVHHLQLDYYYQPPLPLNYIDVKIDRNELL